MDKSVINNDSIYLFVYNAYCFYNKCVIFRKCIWNFCILMTVSIIFNISVMYIFKGEEE